MEPCHALWGNRAWPQASLQASLQKASPQEASPQVWPQVLPQAPPCGGHLAPEVACDDLPRAVREAVASSMVGYAVHALDRHHGRAVPVERGDSQQAEGRVCLRVGHTHSQCFRSHAAGLYCLQLLSCLW